MISVYYITHLEETSTSGKTMSRNKYKACYRRVKSQVKKISGKKIWHRKKKSFVWPGQKTGLVIEQNLTAQKICIFHWLVSKHWKIIGMIQDQNITVHIIMLKHLDLAIKQCSFRDHSQKNMQVHYQMVCNKHST